MRRRAATMTMTMIWNLDSAIVTCSILTYWSGITDDSCDPCIGVGKFREANHSECKWLQAAAEGQLQYKWSWVDLRAWPARGLKTILVNCDALRLSLDRMRLRSNSRFKAACRKHSQARLQQVRIAIVQKSPSPIHQARPLTRFCKWFQLKFAFPFREVVCNMRKCGTFLRNVPEPLWVAMGKMEEGGKTGRNKRLRKNAAPRKPEAKIIVWVSRLVLWTIFSRSLLFETVSRSIVYILIPAQATLQCGPAWPLSLHGQGPYHHHSPHASASDKFWDRRKTA